MKWLLIASASMLTLAAAPASSTAPARQSFAATCAEGETFPGVVLYPRDPHRRIEVAFSDARMTHVSTLILRGTRSVWSVGSMALGDGIDQITSSNGRGFALSGFEWDYGGYVTDLKGGALSRLPGGCTLSIRFSPPANAMSTPEALMGDITLQSTNPTLRRLRPTVTQLSLNWR